MSNNGAYLRYLRTVEIGPSHGTNTFSRSGRFNVGVPRGALNNPLVNFGKVFTKPASIDVFRLVNNSSLLKAFQSLGKNRLRWKSPDQVLRLFEDHPEELRTGELCTSFDAKEDDGIKFRPYGLAVFVEFVNGCVAIIEVGIGGTLVCSYDLSKHYRKYHRWFKHNLFVPARYHH